MRNQLFLILFILTTFCSVSNSQRITPEAAKANLIATIDSILQAKVDRNEIPGAVIEIKKNNKNYQRRKEYLRRKGNEI